ncbi:hypothetical protein ACOTCG_10745 [Achromobacter xylosoxidans]
MSAETCIQPTGPFGTEPKRLPTSELSLPVRPESVMSAPAIPVPPPVGAARPAGLVSRLWRAYREWRSERTLRNLAENMDPHLLRDVGAPEWLVNQSSVEESLKRITRIDPLRW